MSAAALLTLSAFFHALWNAILKKSKEKDFGLLGTMVLAAVTAFILALFLDEPGRVAWENMKFAILAGIAEGGYFICLAKALTHSPLGKSYTIMRGGAMIIVWIVSVLFLHETISGIGILGVGAVFIGLYLTQITGSERIEGAQFRWAYGAAGFIGAYHLFYGEALKNGIPPTMTFTVGLFTSLPLLFYYNRRDFKSRFHFSLRNQFWPMLFGGIICSLSFIIFLNGLAHSNAGFAITLRNSSIVFSQIFAFLIGEKISARQWFGAFVVTIGCGLLVL